MAEQASPYRSLPGTPTSSGGERKKRGIKKIISGFTKKHDPAPEGKEFELATSENGERVHFRDKVSSFFKRGPKDGESSPSEPVHPLKELLNQESKDETEKGETKPGIQKQSDAQDDDTNKHNLVKKAEEVIDSLIHRKRHVHAPAVTEYSNPSQDVVEPNPAERVEEDQIRHDHSQINTENETAAVEEVETGPTPSTPPPQPAQENEVFGCETLAKGVQKICLPWTLNKDQD